VGSFADYTLGTVIVVIHLVWASVDARRRRRATAHDEEWYNGV
jgi:hypothetical protein